jgi:hypothetical protein
MTDDWDESTVLVSCVCDHDPQEHGWLSCEVEGCDCEGNWEE